MRHPRYGPGRKHRQRGELKLTVTSYNTADSRTPVLIGVGQAAERVDDVGYQAMSPVELAVTAARAAAHDTGAEPHAVVAAVDTIVATRQFENSSPGAPALLCRSTKFPLSVAARLGAHPRRAVLTVSGGQSPQQLVNEFTREIACGHADVVLLCGAEAMSTIRHLAGSESAPDFSDDPPGDIEDRGYGLAGLASRAQVAHGLAGAPAQYALLENARRAARAESRQAYSASMGELFAPFTKVAAANPFSAVRQTFTADELIAVSERNRVIAEPYPRFVVARDQVNQGAAVLIASVEAARHLGVASEQWVFLHGQADLREQELLRRLDLAIAPSAVDAVRHALAVAGRTLDEIEYIDFYSCFPIAVSNMIEALGLRYDDPRGLTLTGGLPYFGGAGNNYSMHAIAEAVQRTRQRPGSYALVGANGGVLSKYSVGVYSTAPVGLRPDQSAELQQAIDAADTCAVTEHPSGAATIETYTVRHRRGGECKGIVVGRLDADGSRFLATVADGDDELLDLLSEADEPVGTPVHVTAFGFGNRVTSSKSMASNIFRRQPPSLDDDYEFAQVQRDGNVLVVTINRPEVRNALHPPAHEELDRIFDAFDADPELWVAVIAGAGDKAFCAGNDLVYTARGKQTYLPLNGFAGLTSRRLAKPVIAAVNGYAMGGGFEIALAAHLVVADSAATFALSEVKVGLVAGAGGAVRLPRCIPPKVATELLLLGRRIDAAEAQRLGVVNRIAPAGQALAVARQLAAEIVTGSPTSVRLTLKLMAEAEGIADTVDAVQTPTGITDELMFSEDAYEGMKAFAAKRSPRWRNR
jgi:acetyl-CoA C-acetyltransferase